METELTAVFLAVYGALQTGLVTPLAQWIKKQSEKVFTSEPPLGPMIITYVLSFLCAWGIRAWLQPDLPIDYLILLVLAGKGISNDTHTVVKTVKNRKGGK